MFFKRVMILLFLSLAVFVSKARGLHNVAVERYTSEFVRIEEGLSQNTPYAVLQDSDGFIWVGTWDGLNKFDGYSFTVFRPDKKNPHNSLPSETVRFIYEDDEGYLWLGTEGGLSRLNRYTHEFTNFRHKKDDKYSISSDTIYAITGGPDGILYIATHKGLNIFDKQNNMFSLLENTKSKNSYCHIINTVFLDEEAYLWAGTNCGLFKYDLITGTYYNYSQSDTEAFILSDTVLSFAKDKEGNLWIGTAGGLTKLHKGYEEHTFYTSSRDIATKGALSNSHIAVLLYDRKDNLWVGTNGGGLNLYIKEDDSFEVLKNVPGKRNSLSHNYIYSLADDSFGNIWVAAWKGLNKINLEANIFHHYHYLSGQENSLNNNTVWGFYEDDDGKIWVATEGGINILDREKEAFSYIRRESGQTNTLASDKIRVILKDADGIYWIGTHDNGLNSYDKRTHSFKHYHQNSKGAKALPNNQVWTMAEDHNKDLWFGTFNGLVHYDRTNDVFEIYQADMNDPNTLADNLILDIIVDSRNRLWISTYNGLSVLDIETKQFQTYKNDVNNPASISNSRVFAVTEGSCGYYWVATMGGGLNRFDPTNETFTAYTRADGIANNIVYKALEDNSGNLWITTNSGLTFFNTDSHVFINYDVRDGIQGSEFNGGAAYKTRKGELIVGGMNGFNIFYPDEFTLSTYKPNVVVTSFKIFNKKMPGLLQNNDTIHLTYKENFISFKFSALDFTNPMKNMYAYQLVGFDRDWVYTDATHRRAEYTNIPPGKYKFKVRGTNSHGEWSEEEFVVFLIIRPAWYMMWWFKAGVVLAALLLLGFIAYERYQKVRKKHQWEKQMLAYEKQMFQLRQKALSLQMNPHFIFNTLNAIQHFILKDNSEQAISYMGKLSQLMRLILSGTREMYVPLANEIKVLTHYLDLEKIRFTDKFDYEINVDKDIDAEFTSIPPMIIQPFAENALLHGILHKNEKGFISINIKSADTHNIICTVEDDGVGREKAAEIKNQSGFLHRSRGIAITKDRLGLFTKHPIYKERTIFDDKKNEQGNACGTKVTIILPCVDV